MRACGSAPAPGSPATDAPAASASASAPAPDPDALSATDLLTLTKDDGKTAPASSGGPPGGILPSSKGRLPPEVIQRVVRQHFGRFRTCYEKGLQRDAQLKGRVAIRVEIGRDGRVTQSSDGGSDLPDPEVVRCIAEGFRPIVFPRPDGGSVSVVYPINFAPGG